MSSPAGPHRADDLMTKAIGTACTSAASKPENSFRGEKKKSIIPRIFSSKKNNRENSEGELLQDGSGNENELNTDFASRTSSFLEESTYIQRGISLSDRHSSMDIKSLSFSRVDQSMAPDTVVKDIRFQEIVPLSAGNVLGSEDNEPASKWLALTSYALNKQHHDSLSGSTRNRNSTCAHMFQKPSLKALSKHLREDSDLFKACNCFGGSSISNRIGQKIRDPCADPFNYSRDPATDEFVSVGEISLRSRLNYQLVASKQMVGLFLSVWARRELVKDIGHLRVSCMGRGIMGCLGNKDVDLSAGLYIIKHDGAQDELLLRLQPLGLGEKEGDELRRNSDVAEILKGTLFPRICKNSSRRIPERIINHDRMIWLGDLNYRIGLSYEEARLRLEDNDWDFLLEKDQLNTEREAGRVFSGWKEGKIMFAPTYKYSQNSDLYTGEATKSKRKRRTPAWCDRILWRGKGMEQLSYIRGESRFSDHRPVCAVFAAEVVAEVRKKSNTKFRKGYSCAAAKFDEFEDYIPQRHSFCDV